MSDASRAFTLTVPAGFGASTETSFALSLPVCDVTACLITWPSGCVGLVGAALQAAGTNAFPFGQNQFLAYDDFTYEFQVTNQINSGDWSILAYNQDYFAHTLTVVLEYDYITLGNAPTTSLAISL